MSRESSPVTAILALEEPAFKSPKTNARNAGAFDAHDLKHRYTAVFLR
jgi:hypothetical protein